VGTYRSSLGAKTLKQHGKKTMEFTEATPELSAEMVSCQRSLLKALVANQPLASCVILLNGFV
jgi:hypothetical protein